MVDAVRFVSAGTNAPDIHYVHADHLGSPQKMTDATQALVWDVVYTPFGQVHSITSTATPIRKIFREVFTMAGLPYFNPHSFRNTLVRLGEWCVSPQRTSKPRARTLGMRRSSRPFASMELSQTEGRKRFLRA
ncbi:MAG: RHS domain-containing protein [Nitrospira sp.]|nr:RHS domain-containing protein [Nitrospira sp.]